MKNKNIILYVVIIILVTIVTVSGTYAFFSSTANSSEMNLESSKFEVIYTGGTAITGNLELVKSKEEGLSTEVNIKISDESVEGKANLYINIENITENIAVEAFNWEVYKTVNGNESFVNSGTFIDCEKDGVKKQCESGDKMYIVKDYLLTTTNTTFTVYLWLDGYKVGNEVIGSSFNGYIGAESENITANLG